MNIKDMKNQLLEDMRQGVSDVILGKIDCYETNFLYPNDFQEYIKSIKGKKYDFDCNGWNYDYWDYYIIYNQKYCVSGSGYYGGISFSKCED